jgi:hypothetical protein
MSSEEEIRLRQLKQFSQLKLKAVKQNWDQDLILIIDSFLEMAKERAIPRSQILDLISRLSLRLKMINDEGDRPDYN